MADENKFPESYLLRDVEYDKDSVSPGGVSIKGKWKGIVALRLHKPAQSGQSQIEKIKKVNLHLLLEHLFDSSVGLHERIRDVGSSLPPEYRSLLWHYLC